LHARARTALALVAGAVLVWGLIALPAVAAPRAVISDPDATPSWWTGIAGALSGADNATDVLMTKGDATFVCGTLQNAAGNADISVTKFLGSVKQWTRLWDGPDHLLDGADSMALSADGKWLYVTGTRLKPDGTADIVVLKRAASSGVLKWARSYDGPKHRIDMPAAIGVDRSGNVVVAGISDNASNVDLVVVSWKSTGARRWTWRYDGAGHGFDMVQDALVEANGTTYLTGHVTLAGSATASVTARISSAGKKVWVKSYEGPDGEGAQAAAVTRRPGGGVYVCGGVRRVGSHWDGMVLGYAASGARTVFQFDAGGAATDQFFNDLAVTSTKEVVAVGRYETGVVSSCRLVVHRPNGMQVAGYVFGSPWSDAFRAVATDDLGGFYATGTVHTAADQVRVFTWRGSVVSSAGSWQSRWQAVASPSNQPAAIAVRGASACVVGNYASGGVTGVDQLVLMYRY
jgi:hypothetical protein